MPVHIVGESRLLRDMFLAICQSNDYQIGTCCDELSTLAGLGVDDLVLYYSHETGPELVEELRQFKEGNDASLLILIMGRECSTSMQTALSAYAEAVIPQRKSAEALIAALRVVQSGYRIVPSDISAALRAADVTTSGGDRAAETLSAASPPELELAETVPADRINGSLPQSGSGTGALTGGSTSRSGATVPTDLRRMPASAAAYGLSGREWLILTKLIDGATNKSIANELSICEATVKVHLRTCFRKIGAKNRTQAAIWASEQFLS
ncbi:helix-turn-helix transcriptional regulator [Phaeobacter inhibens]|uniref:helix-turn-helix transcriptional regulator n=1 Tax=Phaeobacter inhibens TaxID=221822 RepID=UPI0021A89BB7|nr:LuxR C-terminal-related transcriptional regulator [Phaeobacter inhibens]UWR70766.1 LuxR C-terminal-related transcriptional regulator [Phaeobacter inhibens]UWR98350.1 LuxR C-terminal-related transcriptional regulator [Phaeobacter inhibens]UWS02287.1 LuxR C-terminal-related transcriptional regulator [Phaeobacter inhibens]UWS06278.1 LuxR C-terminal-related transcriptional regulator [Phaeobacter inhibens]